MAEPDIRVETVVAAPPAVLYEMVSDLTRMGEWSPENTGASWRGGATGPEVGARFVGKNANGWRRWMTFGKVVEAEPGEAFAFDVSAGPLLKVARWRYTFEPADGGTLVGEEWYDQRGALVRLGGKPASGVGDRLTHNRAGMEQTLVNLKAAAEPGADRSSEA
jgi:uncharacterized protein YndB with AHSA1/START domain